MRFHVAFTNLRKDAQWPLFSFCRVFTRPTPCRTVDATKPFGSRPYGVKKPSNSKSLQNANPNDPVLEQTCANQRSSGCSNGNDANVSHPSREELASKHVDHHTDEGRSRGMVDRTRPPHPIIPSTRWQLYQEILRLISLTPPAPFSRLMSLHQRYATLQSVESYNLLLQLAVRHSLSRYTHLLIKMLALNRIEPNSNTEKLVVRYLITRGKWKQAWRQTVRRYPSVTDIPMAVLLELLAPGTRQKPPKEFRPAPLHVSQVVSRPLSRLVDRPPRSSRHDTTEPNIPLDTLILILLRFPKLHLDELARLPLRVISYAVRGLIRNGHHDEAIALTENHLKTISPNVHPKWLGFARDLVHLHLTSGEIKLANYKKRRRLVEHMFSLCPSLHPNSETVFLLMRYMGRSKRCGIEAYLFYKDYRARWGTVVESTDVRRRIIAYALKQRKLGIAKEISLEGPLEDPLPSHQGTVGRAPGSLLPVRPWRTMYPRKGIRSRRWKRLLIRVLGRRRERQRARKKGELPPPPWVKS